MPKESIIAIIMSPEEAKEVKRSITLSLRDGGVGGNAAERLKRVLDGILEAEQGHGFLCGAIDPSGGKPGLNAIPYPPRKMRLAEKIDFYDHLIEEGLGKVDLKAVLKRLENLRKGASCLEDEAKADLSVKAVRELIADCD